MKNCQICNKQFEIFNDDKKFYQALNVLEPIFCPDCRLQRRLAWRNVRKLYYNKCSNCQKQGLSMLAQNSIYKNYCRECYLSDTWDAVMFGQNIDTNKNFFQQFDQLLKNVPFLNLSLNDTNTENSDYCNNSSFLKNCYLSFGASNSENTYYSENINKVSDSSDIFDCNTIELSYEITNANTIYNSQYCANCTSLTDCFFCNGCVSCNHCFGCTNLYRKEYCWLNEQLTEEQYKKKKDQINFGSYKQIETIKADIQKLLGASIVCYNHNNKAENSTGDYLYFVKNVKDSYFMINCEDCNYCFGIQAPPLNKSLYDSTYWGGGLDTAYECIDIGDKGFNLKFCNGCTNGCMNLDYCVDCSNCKNCFGCVGLFKKEFFILNKEYSEAEYYKNVEKLKDKMINDHESGLFFPPTLSRFGYNETEVNYEYPLTKEEAIHLGYKWQDLDSSTTGKETITVDAIEDDIRLINDTICQEILACKKCHKNYKIIIPEFKFYKNNNIPIPRECSECRYVARRSLRNPKKLVERQCMCDNPKHGHEGKCVNRFLTNYLNNRTEKVYCKDCYQKVVY